MAVNQALNDTELERLLREPLKEAVDYVVQKIIDTNEAEISKIVYAAYDPINYERTGEFQRAWDTIVTTKTGDSGATVEGSFFYAPGGNRMSSQPPSPANGNMGIHHGISTRGTGKFRSNGQMASQKERSEGQWGDSREYLADIIYQGLAGDIYGNGAWTKKRDAFDALVKYIGKQRMKQWFETGMEKAGLSYVRHVAGIQVSYE